MGTFVLRPTSITVQTNTWRCRIGGPEINNPTDEELVEAVATDFDDRSGDFFAIVDDENPGAHELQFSCLGDSLYLDGSLTPIDVNSLPPNFEVLDCDVKGFIEVSIFGTGSDEISLQRNGSTLATQTGVGITVVDHNLGAISNLSLATSTLGFIATSPSVPNQDYGGGLRIEGTYQAGPYTLTPPGGNVEPGQTITVEGPNAGSLEYAALQGDKVIPLDPKVVDPDTVILEVPNPPTDSCEDCLGDCTNCEDCFDACNEDLTSAACKECMAECLECLEECLESLESAEECQESKQDPPADPTEIIIICGGPGFTGSVPLGTFTIIVANGSGIYEFVEGKTNDTLYSAFRDGSTYDVRIPTPGGKTGFFRS